MTDRALSFPTGALEAAGSRGVGAFLVARRLWWLPAILLLAIAARVNPLVRRVHGSWVGSTFGLWITQMSLAALARGPNEVEARTYESYLRLDRQMLVADIVNKRPDAILVAGSPWLAWARSNPDVAAALAPYRLLATADDVMVFTREAAPHEPAPSSDRPVAA